MKPIATEGFSVESLLSAPIFTHPLLSEKIVAVKYKTQFLDPLNFS